MSQARLLVVRALAMSGGGSCVEAYDPKAELLKLVHHCITCGSPDIDEYTHRNLWGNFIGWQCNDCGQFWTRPGEPYGYPNGLKTIPDCMATLEYNKQMRERSYLSMRSKTEECLNAEAQETLVRRRVHIVEVVDPKAMVLAAAPQMTGQGVADEIVNKLVRHYQGYGGYLNWSVEFAGGKASAHVKTSGTRTGGPASHSRPIYVEVYVSVPWQSGYRRSVYYSVITSAALRQPGWSDKLRQRVMKGVALALEEIHAMSGSVELHNLNQEMMEDPDWADYAGQKAEELDLPTGYEQQTPETMSKWRELMRAYAEEKGMDVPGL